MAMAVFRRGCVIFLLEYFIKISFVVITDGVHNLVYGFIRVFRHGPTPEQAHRGCRLMTLALIYDDKVKKCQTNCSVLRTLAILLNIRISRSLRFPFMLISGRVIKPCTHS